MLRYHGKYVADAPLEGAPLVPLYGVYKATTHDGDDDLHEHMATAFGLETWQRPVETPLPVSALADHGFALFGGGVGHAELRARHQDHDTQPI